MIFEPESKKVYIVVKTYPTISKKYAELVCTAGVLEDGSWIRLYPIPFRKLEIEQKYHKYTWVNLDVVRNTADFRPETYRPYDLTKIRPESASKILDWDERRSIIFKNKKIYTNMQELIDKAKLDMTSLAIFKPTKVNNFTVESVERDWDPDKLAVLQAQAKQMTLFETPEEIEQEFKIVRKVPYKFSYIFEDDSGKKHKLMIEDWEIGMLYFNCLEKACGDEKVAIVKVKEKYFNEFSKRDLYFFLGTTLEHHKISINPFIIIGTFYPPKYQQTKLFE